jgi:hypothetical protein
VKRSRDAGAPHDRFTVRAWPAGKA